MARCTRHHENGQGPGPSHGGRSGKVGGGIKERLQAVASRTTQAGKEGREEEDGRAKEVRMRKRRDISLHVSSSHWVDRKLTRQTKVRRSKQWRNLQGQRGALRCEVPPPGRTEDIMTSIK